MPVVTVIALIYRSSSFARDFYQSLMEATPELRTGVAEFFYVANNPGRRVIRTLQQLEIPHHVFVSPVLTDRQHFLKGYAAPEYIGRVYRAYNFGVQMAKSDLVVLLNSDMVMSQNWLSQLLEESDNLTVLSPKLVERKHPRFGVFPGAEEKNLGRDFRSMDFLGWKHFTEQYIEKHQSDNLHEGGPYMPALFRKLWFETLGGFPEGNIAGSSYDDVLEYGDESFFNTLKSVGIAHKTTPRALCYHFKEGERATNPFIYLLTIALPGFVAHVRKVLK